MAKPIERLVVDLEELVARIVLEHVEERLAANGSRDRSPARASTCATLWRR